MTKNMIIIRFDSLNYILIFFIKYKLNIFRETIRDDQKNVVIFDYHK